MNKTNSVIQQNSTDLQKGFAPSKGMLKWLEVTERLGFTTSFTDVAKAAKLDRSSWYKWLDIPGFVEWWDNKWKQYLNVNRWKLDAIGMEKAKSEYSYWHDMQERVGNIVPPNQVAPPAGNNVQINIPQLTEEQIKRIVED